MFAWYYVGNNGRRTNTGTLAITIADECSFRNLDAHRCFTCTRTCTRGAYSAHRRDVNKTVKHQFLCALECKRVNVAKQIAVRYQADGYKRSIGRIHRVNWCELDVCISWIVREIFRPCWSHADPKFHPHNQVLERFSQLVHKNWFSVSDAIVGILFADGLEPESEHHVTALFRTNSDCIIH